MPGKEIKHTIRLEGEREYSQAIREAQRNLRTLRSELKAETAELGSNATAQQKNETRAKSLKAQIAEQEKVVETLKKALAEAKKDYADNEDVVQKWEQKLNEARTTLANMQNGLADTENAMRGVSGATAEGVTATKSFADALDSISSVGESVSGAIEDIFTGLISTVRDVVVDLWDLIGDTAAKANNWTDIAGYWGTDPVEVQKWNRAIEGTANTFADFETVVSQLALGGKSKEITEMLGISDVNYKSDWEYAIAVMREIYNLSKSGELPDNIWETIFGQKKATKAMDLVNDWEAIEERLTTFDPENGGFGLNKEETAAMTQYKMDIAEIEQKWEALKDKVAAGLGVIAADLLVNVSGGLDALNDYLNADTEEERQAAIQKLETNVRELFEKVAAAIEAGLEVLARVGSDLQNSDDPIVQAIGNILTGITDALQWLVDNQDSVVTALKAIFGTWLTAKLATIAGKLASIVADIQTIQMFKSWSGIGSGVANAAGAAAGGGAANAAGAAAGGGAAGGGILSGLGASAGSVLGPLAGGMALAGVIHGPWLAALDQKHRDELWGEYNENEEQNEARRAQVQAEGDAEVEHLQRLLDQMLQAVDGDETFDPGADLTEPIKDAFRENANEYLELAPNSDFWNWANQFADTEDGLDADEIEQIIQNIDIGDAWQEFGIDVANAVSDKVDQLLAGGGESQSQQGLTSEDTSFFRGLPGLMRQALMSRINGIEVVMDGEKVGRLVMPYVGGGFYRMVTE